jgi:hypothetical protein
VSCRVGLGGHTVVLPVKRVIYYFFCKIEKFEILNVPVYANKDTKLLTFVFQRIDMTERELIKLEATIRKKMDDIKQQRVSVKDSGIGSLLNMLKKVDEALYEKILPEYKKLVSDYNIFK